jgi:cephalosporin hydroxylase
VIIFDDKNGFVSELNDDGVEIARHALATPEAFELMNKAWLRASWDVKYIYSFAWMGRPMIQLPEDMMRIQEVIWEHQPDVVIETGVAHGGSLILYASLFKAMGKGRVIGVDIEIRPHNRKGIETHELGGLITLIEGSSTAASTLEQVRSQLKPGETVLVILDSDHSKGHVAAELEAYQALVTPGSYIVATDGIMKDLHDVPRGRPEWTWDHPTAAAAEFAQAHPEFVLEQPAWLFNESGLSRNLTHWPGAYLRRL